MTQDTQPNDFDALFPDEVTVGVAGEKFLIKAFMAGAGQPYMAISRRQSAKAQALMNELAAEYEKAVKAAKKAKKSLPEPLDVDQIPLELLHERCIDEYIELVSLATGKPIKWVANNVGIDELITIAGVINELNSRRYLKKGPALTITPGRQG